MPKSDQLPYQDHHWEVSTPSRKVKHDGVKVLPSGVLEARDRAFETVEDVRTPYRRVVMLTSTFYAPGYWLSVERGMGDKRGGGAF